MIKVVAYNSQWPEEFLVIAAKIRQAVGEKAFAIHHIGSTSIPELIAKDVIDIQMTVLDLQVPLQKELLGIGFELGEHTKDHCPPGMNFSPSELEKRYYRGGPRKVHLHIRKQNMFNQRYPILFRDFLRSNPNASRAYGEIKLQLAKYFPENVDAYYDIKDPVCDAIMSGAFEWAKNCNWSPGATEA